MVWRCAADIFFSQKRFLSSGHRGPHLLLLQQGYFFNGKHDIYIYIYMVYIYTKLTAISIWIKDVYANTCKHHISPKFSVALGSFFLQDLRGAVAPDGFWVGARRYGSDHVSVFAGWARTMRMENRDCNWFAGGSGGFKQNQIIGKLNLIYRFG